MKHLDNCIDQILLYVACLILYIQRNYWNSSVLYFEYRILVVRSFISVDDAALGFVMTLCLVQKSRQGKWNVLSVNGDM